jgi:oxygen-dependent protoporphyrinogen oxidase
MRRTIVIGAGVSGLSAALRLRTLDPAAELEILEAAPVPGGWLRTDVEDGFVIERGPDAILAEKPAAIALVRRLGIEHHVVRTAPGAHGAYVVADGRLARVPDGFSMIGPTALGPFLRAAMIGPAAKLRALLEPFVPRRHSADDESLARFVRRRLGEEVLERLVEPLVAGIYGCDAEQLSIEATMPRWPAMEREHGSVLRGLRARARAAETGGGAASGGERASGARYGLFFNFDRGMQVLTDALVAAVGRDRIRLGAPVRALARQGGSWRVLLEDGTVRQAERVVVATGAPCAAAILRAGGVDAAIADGLDAIPHGSAATVTLAWRIREIPRPLDAYGFVVPAVERRAILASTWSSAKWPGRAPEGWALIRVFIGGVHAPDAAELDEPTLVGAARRELRALMGIDAPPAWTRIVRYPRAMPIYTLGHRARAAAIDARVAALPGFALAGNALGGVGVPDAIASGERAAERLAGTGS